MCCDVMTRTLAGGTPRLGRRHRRRRGCVEPAAGAAVRGRAVWCFAQAPWEPCAYGQAPVH